MFSKKINVIGGVRTATGALLAAVLAGSSGCSPSVAPIDQVVSEAQVQVNPAALASSFKLAVRTTSGNDIFIDNNAFSLFEITKGTAYNVTVTSTNAPAGATLELQITSNAQVGATAKVIALSPSGDQTWKGAIPANLLPAADYNAQLIIKGATGAKLTAKNYTASVSCASSPLSVVPSAQGLVTATAAGKANFNFDATALVSAVISSNSGAPTGASAYRCAFDFTGIAAMDGTFGPCTLPNIVANYVGTRNISVQVRESTCNTSLRYTTPVTLAGNNPGGDANSAPFAYNNVPSSYSDVTFIWGQIQNGSSGLLSTNARLGGAGATPGVNYLAAKTPQASYLAVQNQGGGGKLTGFNISANYAYAQPGVVSPAKFGMEIQVNLGAQAINALNLPEGTSNPPIKVNTAKVAHVAYKTDQIGDSDPAATLEGSNCTTNAVYVQPTLVSLAEGSCPGSCTVGSGGVGVSYNVTFLAWGDYSCQVSDGTSTATIRGTFAGQPNIQGDTTQCSCGGGGQGGGSGGGPMSF